MFEIDIIEQIQRLRCAFMDMFCSAVTMLGDEMFFILVAVIIFWCVDKRFGYKLINVYLCGCAVVEAVKLTVRRPRPFTNERIESIGEKSTGYSFPSGHSHSIANLTTQLSRKYRKVALIVALSVVSVLVAFSRMYLGQHYLSDVLTGLTLGFVFAWLFSMLYDLLRDREEYIVAVVFPLCAVILIVCAAVGYDHATAYNVLGGYAAVTLGYFLEKRYIRFDVKACLGKQLIKIFIGGCYMILFKEGLKMILPENIPALYNSLRYFLTGLVAIAGLPAIFKALSLSGDFRKKPKNGADGQ